MTTYVNIEFASPKIKAVDYFDDIFNAVDYAKLNLKSRRNIHLHNPIISAGRVWVPVTHFGPFNAGYSLRGIAYYLLHRTNGSTDYSKYYVGKRLLIYDHYTSLPGVKSAEEPNITFREMTIQEIEKELGYRVRIVGEK